MLLILSHWSAKNSSAKQRKFLGVEGRNIPALYIINDSKQLSNQYFPPGEKWHGDNVI